MAWQLTFQIDTKTWQELPDVFFRSSLPRNILRACGKIRLACETKLGRRGARPRNALLRGLDYTLNLQTPYEHVLCENLCCSYRALATSAGPGEMRLYAYMSGDMRMRVLTERAWETPLRKSCLRPWKVYIHSIRESVDSLCRDDADMPMPPYIRKACNRPNAAFVSLFR